MCYGEGEKDNIIDTQNNHDYFVINFLSNCPTELRSKWTKFIIFNTLMKILETSSYAVPSVYCGHLLLLFVYGYDSLTFCQQ